MRDRFGIDWSKARGTHFWNRPALDRRVFLRHAGSALTGSFFLGGPALRASSGGGAQPKGTARNVIFVLMSGGPSHVDTFDLKEGAWTLPAMEPTSYGAIRWPRGLMPRLAEAMGDIALLRSVRAWEAVHGIAQVRVQIGRNPVASTSSIAPHIGSVVSRELRDANAVLPAFLSLNAGSGPGQGYLEPVHAPFYVSPGGTGLGNTTHPAGQAAFERRFQLLMQLEGESGAAANRGDAVREMAEFNAAARKLAYNADVDRVFTFAAEERQRYGNSNFGNACLTARNLLRANLGTRFVQITTGGWDNHANIYQGAALNPTNANSVARQFDAGLGALLADLKTDGLLDQTLVVALGEFGRTVGALNNQAGRDHFLTQAVLMAGGGVKGGQVVGQTDERGQFVTEPGWQAGREARAEDIEATIYSALGIDWTKAYYDDPLGRGFYLVPNNQGFDYMPVHELWG
jgi:hypothetical protein